ncbi:hypothetical protein [Priestia aryabhattai]
MKYYSLRVSEEELKAMLGSMFFSAQEQIKDFHELFMESYAATYPSDTISGKEALFKLREQLPNPMKEKFLIIALMRCFRTLEGKDKHENVIFPPGVEEATEELIFNYPELRNMSLDEMEEFMKDNSEVISKILNKGRPDK